MRMFYFSEKGVNEVINKYQNLIGGQFYFNNDILDKNKLMGIFIGKSIINNGFVILFVSDNIKYFPIDEFMAKNNIEYNFEDFDRVYIDSNKVFLK